MKAMRAVASALSGAVLAFGGVAAWDSPVFALRRVEVGGNHRVQARDVVVSSDLSHRDHLLRLSTSGIASAVRRSPWVAEARVERILPSKVRITVVERVPAAAVVAGGIRYLVDADGMVLEQVDDAVTTPEHRGVRLPLVTELPVGALMPGRHVVPAQYRQSLAILGSLPQEIRRRVTVVRAPSTEAITLEVSDGPVIAYGAAEAMGDKTFAIKALMNQAAKDGRGIESIDVRVPTRPALKLR